MLGWQEHVHGLYSSSIALSKDLLQRLMMEKCLGEESEDDVELNLGLSLGGCHGRTTKSKAGSNSNGFGNSQRDGGSGDFGLQRKDSHGHGLGSGNFGFGEKEESKQEEVPKMQDQEMVVLQKKRELHALRRQEARKKREEKQLQRARREGGGIRPVQSKKGRNGFVPLAPSYAPFPMRGASVFPGRVGTGRVVLNEEDKRVLGAQMASVKNKQRAAKESEPCRSDKKEAKGDPSIDDKSSRTSHEADNMVPSSNGGDHPAGNEVSASGPETTTTMASAYPALPISSYPFAPQCVPVPMGVGFSYPYMMSYWPAASTRVDAPKGGAATHPLPPNVLQPIPTRAFSPFQIPVSQTSWYADPQIGRGTGTAHSSHASGASSGRSSSAVSEYESRSSQGASSNDTKSQSSTSSALERERLQRASSISKTQDQTRASSEVSTASQLEPLKSPEVVATGKVPNNAGESTMASRTATMHEKKTREASSTRALQQGRASTPPNTEISNYAQSQGLCPLSTMPSVSTNFEGGKTVNGLLYSYAKGDVKIVCVCHGTFLSPAEFVQHAGGTDILHPEKHIVVNPSFSAMQHTPTTGEGSL